MEFCQLAGGGGGEGAGKGREVGEVGKGGDNGTDLHVIKAHECMAGEGTWFCQKWAFMVIFYVLTPITDTAVIIHKR